MSQTTIELHKAYAQKQHNKYHPFSPFAMSYVKDSLTQYYRCLEQDKKHAYEARVREVELGCFAPLVFSTSGGLHVGPAAKTVHRRLALLIAEKHDQPYSLNPFLAPWQIELFCCYILQSCLCGSRLSYHRGGSPLDSAIDLSCSAGRINVCVYLYALIFVMMLFMYFMHKLLCCFATNIMVALLHNYAYTMYRSSIFLIRLADGSVGQPNTLNQLVFLTI